MKWVCLCTQRERDSWCCAPWPSVEVVSEHPWIDHIMATSIPWVKGTISDGVSVGQPGQKSLQVSRRQLNESAELVHSGTCLNSQAIATVFTRPVFALIREPVIRGVIDTFPFISCNQLFHVRNPHRSTLSYNNIDQHTSLILMMKE